MACLKPILLLAGVVLLLYGLVPTRAGEPYQQVVQKVQTQQQRLQAQYQGRQGRRARAQLLQQGDAYVFDAIYKRLMPHWYGTAWDFNGTTRTPGKGAIACGYFVSTVLQDAGFRVERYRLAQQASENIIRSLTITSKPRRYSRVPMKRFIGDIRKWGKGIYVVGLDLHVGFIVHDGSEIYFIHSTYVPPTKVIKEVARDSEILAASQYRVLAKLSGDRGLMQKWMRRQHIPTRRR